MVGRHLIRYSNGDEELYDHKADQNEWKNLADERGYEAVKRDLAKYLPMHDKSP